jgi:hypothetical protein
MSEGDLGSEMHSNVSGTILAGSAVVGVSLNKASREVGVAAAPLIGWLFAVIFGPIYEFLPRTKNGYFDNWGLRVGTFEGFLLGGPIFERVGKALGMSPMAYEFSMPLCGMLFLGPLLGSIFVGAMVKTLQCIKESLGRDPLAGYSEFDRQTIPNLRKSVSKTARFIKFMTIFGFGYVGWRVGYVRAVFFLATALGERRLFLARMPDMPGSAIALFHGVWIALIFAVLGDPIGGMIGKEIAGKHK